MTKFDFTDNAVKVIMYVVIGVTFCFLIGVMTYSSTKRLEALERCYEAATVNQKLNCNF